MDLIRVAIREIEMRMRNWMTCLAISVLSVALGFGIASFSSRTALEKKVASNATADLMLLGGLLETLEGGNPENAKAIIAFRADESLVALADLDMNSLPRTQRQFLVHVVSKYKTYREQNSGLYVPPPELGNEKKAVWAERDKSIRKFLAESEHMRIGER